MRAAIRNKYPNRLDPAKHRRRASQYGDVKAV
jgi:hypothetical protein